MAYTNSKLVTYTKLSPNCNKPRENNIDTITIHCYVGQVTAKQGCDRFANPLRGASCNYVVGYDGSIGLCVEEANRSWCSGGKDKLGRPIKVNGITGKMNDHRAITIEVASDKTHPYKVTDKAYNALVDLVTDICERNNIKRLLWKGDKNLVGKTDQQNMTVHRWFANKACPGDYLYGKYGEIAEEVNKRINGDDGGFTPYMVKITKPPVNIRKEPNAKAKVVGKITTTGVYTIVEEAAPNGTTYGWGKLKRGDGWITLSPNFVKKV